MLAALYAVVILLGVVLFVTADSPFDITGVTGIILYIFGWLFGLLSFA